MMRTSGEVPPPGDDIDTSDLYGAVADLSFNASGMYMIRPHPGRGCRCLRLAGWSLRHHRKVCYRILAPGCPDHQRGEVPADV
jgi:hypothetical protein